jgi:hypothetical protein
MRAFHTLKILLLVLIFPCIAYGQSYIFNPVSNRPDLVLDTGDLNGTYVNIAGDTMTGNLTLPEVVTTGTGERILGNTYGNYFDFNDEGNGVIAVSPTIALINATAPTSPTASGVQGQLAYDGTYWYVCTATNTWMRTQLSTWAVTRDLLMLEGIQLQLEGVDLQL